MAKTLIIKGVSFSTNKLDTVVFDGVPCTGITLDSDTMSFTTYGQEIEVEYTLTPENTTDIPNVVSNNENIVVIENGKAKAIGVGTTTITITCGEQTATISVSSAMKMENKTYKSQVYLSKPSGDYARETSSEKFGYFGTTEEWGSKRVAAITATPYIPVARIPKNTASISAVVPDSTHKVILQFYDSTQSGLPGDEDIIAKCLQCPLPSDVPDFGDRTVPVPNGADSFTVTYRRPSGTFSPSLYENMDVTFNPVT